MQHLKASIYGRVQGVFYRMTAQKKAKNLGIKGWIKNMPDGSVYLEADGDEESLKKFLNWCKKGPFLAKVKNIKKEFESETKGFKDFKIRF